jgi:hypothetical protein
MIFIQERGLIFDRDGFTPLGIALAEGNGILANLLLG